MSPSLKRACTLFLVQKNLVLLSQAFDCTLCTLYTAQRRDTLLPTALYIQAAFYLVYLAIIFHCVYFICHNNLLSTGHSLSGNIFLLGLIYLFTIIYWTEYIWSQASSVHSSSGHKHLLDIGHLVTMFYWTEII